MGEVIHVGLLITTSERKCINKMGVCMKFDCDYALAIQVFWSPLNVTTLFAAFYHQETQSYKLNKVSLCINSQVGGKIWASQI